MITAELQFTPGPDPTQALMQAALRGLRNGGEHVLKLSRDRVPLEEGTLERSGQVTDDGKSTVAVSYDTPYATRQHEDLSLRHAQGRQAKFLETAAADGRQQVAALVAAECRKVTGG